MYLQERFQVKNPPHTYIQKLRGYLDPGVTRKVGPYKNHKVEPGWLMRVKVYLQVTHTTSVTALMHLLLISAYQQALSAVTSLKYQKFIGQVAGCLTSLVLLYSSSILQFSLKMRATLNLLSRIIVVFEELKSSHENCLESTASM